MTPKEAYISGYMNAIADIHGITAKSADEYGNKVFGFILGILTRNSLDIEAEEKTED